MWNPIYEASGSRMKLCRLKWNKKYYLHIDEVYSRHIKM